MRWPSLEQILPALQLPPDIEALQLGRAELLEWTRALSLWHPDLAIGEEKDLLHPELYEEEAALRGEREGGDRALYGFLLRSQGQIIAGILAEYDESEDTVVGRMSSVSPQWRGRGLGRTLLRAQEFLGRGAGAHSVWGLVEPDNSAQRRALEGEGWWLSGLIPECDQRRFGNDSLYVPEALYVKPLIPAQDLVWPESEVMTERVAALFALLRFPGSPQLAAARPDPLIRSSPPQLTEKARQALARRPPGAWPQGELVVEQLQLPEGFRMRPQERRDIGVLIQNLERWHPHVALSAHRELLTPRFYEERVPLAGEEQRIAERPFYLFVIEHAGSVMGLCSVSVEEPGVTMKAELLTADPRYHQEGLMQRVAPAAILMAQAVGVETLLCRSSLRHPAPIAIVESAGFALWGVVPASDLVSSKDGRERRGFAALHGVSLIPPEQVRWPDEQRLPEPLRTLSRTVRSQSVL